MTDQTYPFDEHDAGVEIKVEHAFDGSVKRCRWAFTLAALGLGIQTVDLVLGRFADLTRGRANDPAIRSLLALMESPQWSWWVGTPITWFTLIASYALVGVVRTPTWTTRSILLAAMNTVDLGLWLIAHAGALGLGEAVGRLLPPFSLLRIGLESLQWFELIMFAGLCTELGKLINRHEMEAAQYAARASALGGLLLWGVNFMLLISWSVQPFPRVGWRQQMEWHMFRSISLVLLAITVFQVTALCLTAARRCLDWQKRYIAGQDRDSSPANHDPFFDEWEERDRNAWN